jgi:hypothetical protein
MFRLHIDIPISEDENEAQEVVKKLQEGINSLPGNNDNLKKSLSYRLSRDEDRTVRNYLIKNENGHASTKKSKLIKEE